MPTRERHVRTWWCYVWQSPRFLSCLPISLALCARTQRQLISSVISRSRRGCTRAIIWTLSPCRNYVIPGNRERRSESQLVYLDSLRARKVLSRVSRVTICSQMIRTDIVFQNYRHFFFSCTEKIIEKKNDKSITFSRHKEFLIWKPQSIFLEKTIANKYLT